MRKAGVFGTFLILAGIIFYSNQNLIYGYAKLALRTISTIINSCEKENDDIVWGIDISHHQKLIDWDLLVDHNPPDFIFLKATEGETHQDTKYEIYKTEANKRGISTGAYHFFSYQSPGKNQAENFIQHSKLKKGDLFPVLDIEFKKDRPNNPAIRKEVRDFCEVIKEEYGVYPIIYCEYDYYKNILQIEFKDFNYWISDLYREPRCEYVFWQYTEQGEVKGIGKIDNNKLNKNKNLSDYILKK